MGRVRRGELPWTTIDALHRRILDDILQEFSIPELSEDERSYFNRVWHRLDPWPDVVGRHVAAEVQIHRRRACPMATCRY